MSNPYEPSRANAPRTFASFLGTWTVRQWLTAAACTLAIVVLFSVSAVLIMQALRLNAESASLPVRFQADYASTARSSWIGAAAALLGTVLNAAALVFVSRNKFVVPMALFTITLLGMMAIAIIFKPT